jgi:hypothetical protein
VARRATFARNKRAWKRAFSGIYRPKEVAVLHGTKPPKVTAARS